MLIPEFSNLPRSAVGNENGARNTLGIIRKVILNLFWEFNSIFTNFFKPFWNSAQVVGAKNRCKHKCQS